MSVSSAASTNDLLTGLGLVVVLAVGSQLLAGRRHRLAPTPGRTDLLPPVNEAAIVGSEDLTLDAFSERLRAGGRLVSEAADGEREGEPVGSPLFAVTNQGGLRVATPARPLDAHDGETVISLEGARTPDRSATPPAPAAPAPR